MKRIVLGILLGLATIAGAAAQTPPSATEIAAYGGLHAAAWRGDAEEVRRLVRAGAAVDSQDGNGRTPLHVAAFAGHGAVARALLAAGANPALLDHQRYAPSRSRRCATTSSPCGRSSRVAPAPS